MSQKMSKIPAKGNLQVFLTFFVTFRALVTSIFKISAPNLLEA